MSVAFSVWCGGSDFIFLGRTSLISRAQKVYSCTILTSRTVSRFNLVGNCETSINEGEGTEPDSAGTKSITSHFSDCANCSRIQSGANCVQIQSGEGEGTEPDFAGIKSRALYNPHFANSVQIQSGVAEKGFFDIIKVLDEEERKRAWESRLK